MQLRKAVFADLAAINEIYNQAVQELFSTAHLRPVSMEYREQWFASHHPDRYPVLVAETEGAVAGWISLSPYRSDRQALEHVAEVSYYVHREERRRGIGDLLLEHVLETAPGYGFEVLIAILLDKNPASISLLEKHGFSRWGTMPGIARIGPFRADHLYYGLKL